MSVTVNLKGVRIEKTEFFQGKQYTVVSSPAPDAFSHPSKYRLTSDQPLGQVNQLVDVDVTARGIVVPKQFIDKNTGQQKTYDNASVFFDVFAVRPHQPPLSVTK